ncbi:intermembrane phospholipid transport protein YdbH family protein [Sphingosinicella terrae]|uniref:intermembrane phospholipid transport protein YdbH family protein n=1 Tax=Sphingosinicella terrae TaxID=2172047 RepID=UPI002547146F|nr:YdbH domain-containing protein [Sphingosinicella terrae]
MRRRRWRLVLAILLLLLLAGLLLLWSMRVRLASGYIDRELARRGVQAAYEVRRIGFGTQVLENLVIGDPRNPDATARRVEVQLVVGFTGPEIGLITARGVRMRGRVVDGRVSFGQIDRLLPPPSGLPFRLPDQRVDVADAAIALDTPAGAVALGLEGQGNLADGFRGRLALVSRRLQLGSCRLDAPRAHVAVAVDDLRPRFRGPAALQALDCGTALQVARPVLALDATFAPALDSWRGETALRALRLDAGGQSLSSLQGRVGFAGDSGRTRGTLSLTSGRAEMASFGANQARLEGRYALSLDRGDLALAGDLRAAGLRVAGGALSGVSAALRGTEGTPVAPIGAALAAAVDRAGRGGAETSARLTLVNGRGFGAVRVEDMRLATRSGAALRTIGGRGLTYYWPSGAMRLDGEFALSGGGFPDARFSLRQSAAGAPLEGIGRIAPMRAGDARLALDEIRFAAMPDGTSRFVTALQLDGPVAGGRVSGLTVPLRGRFGRGGLAIGEGCVAAGFRTLEIGALRLGPTRLPLCATGPALLWQDRGGALRGGAEWRTARLTGRLGESRLGIAADRLRIDLDGFTTGTLAIRLGEGEAQSRLDIGRLDGRFANGGVGGAFADLSGQIANVPLLVGEGAGRWTFVAGDLAVDGRLQVKDAQDPARFHPLVAEDFRLSLADNRIHASGGLQHPASGTGVALATIDHDLGSGAGTALLDVPGLTFTPSFQPEALTPLTIGVVALVDGTVTGQGRIEWDAQASRSSGTFSTAGMNLAAPFGPVEGLTTSIAFTDLLGLTSAPGQIAEMDRIQAGIDVYDGRVAFQLLPNYHVQVEQGRWPFAGGELFLDPTLLDFSQPSTKYLTFRVDGMDAAIFVQQMEFSNISATGTFDGVVPMRFDIRGGEIVDGRLAARPEGGTLSYVGELTDRDLGAYGVLAFNALKSLRYNRFDIRLNGALDGEFITIIDLDGIARDPELTSLPSGGGIPQLVAGRVINQLSRVPFEFNIRIEGQFRSLIATARSFSDPTPLIQQVLPGALREGATSVSDVQDEESEPVQ